MIKEITVTKEDFIKYSKFACSRLTQPKVKISRPFSMNLVIWFVVSLALFMFIQSRGFPLPNFHWPSALATSVPFLIFIFAFFAYLNKIEKGSIPKENGLMLGFRTIEINESGIKDFNHLGTSTYNWEALEEIVTHEGNVYLFLDTILAQIIPSSAFETKSDMEEFVQFISTLHHKSLKSEATEDSSP